MSLRDAFGPDLHDDPAELGELGRTTYAHVARVLGRLVVRDVAGVQRAVRAAAIAGVALAPVSRGKNWGWGTCAPHADGAVVLDLSEMRAILDYSDELGYVTVQPGVSVADVVALLDERHATRMLPMGGTTAAASLVGHLCERGVSVGTLYHDRASHACGLEAVLADGRIVHTGMRRFGRGAVAATHRFGPGPGLESLLTQSGLAIVTEATIWLPRRPVDPFLALAVGDDLAGLVDALRDLMGMGVRVAPQIYNRAKVERLFLARARLPGGLTLPPGAWVAMIPAYPASSQHAAADRAALEAALPRVPGVRAAILPLDPAMGPFAGRPYPDDDVLSGMLYRFGEERRGPGVDPQRDGCGIVWGCYATTMAGADVARACAVIERRLAAAGLEVFQAVHAISERAALAFPQLSFPAARAAEATAALCALTLDMHAAGFPSYRVPAGAGGVPRSLAATDEVVGAIHRLLDPAGALARGKYAPG
jgi:4-cresol dehydrogenase (hydroxylating)